MLLKHWEPTPATKACSTYNPVAYSCALNDPWGRRRPHSLYDLLNV